MLLHRLFRSEPLLKSSQLLLTVRVWFYGVAWVHLVTAAIVLLPIDMSGDSDPIIREYQQLKWRFITAWFNLINLAYFPLCLYCDWKEKVGEGEQSHVSKLRRIRDIVFTSILFPTILFADIIFWRLYYHDASLISPIKLFDYMPPWGQYSLHTVSIVVAILDLVLVPRRRPESLKPRLILMTVFFFIYSAVVFEAYCRGQMVYQVLGKFSSKDALILVIMFYLEYLFYFFIQWLIIDLVWGKLFITKEVSKRVSEGLK